MLLINPIEECKFNVIFLLRFYGFYMERENNNENEKAFSCRCYS